MEKTELNRKAAIAFSLIRDHKLETPFLFLDEEGLFQALNLFQTYLPKVQLFYAAKANHSPHLIKFFVDNWLSLDVSSAGEISRAIEMQISADRLFLSTPVKTLPTLEALFRYRIKRIAVDTLAEVEKIWDYRKIHCHTHLPHIFVRIKIESKNVVVDLNTKFGCTLIDALNIIKMASDLGFIVEGICFHVGTQSTNSDNYFLGIEIAKLLANEAFRQFGIHIQKINIGGGFCDPVAARNAGVDLKKYYQEIGNACRQAQDLGFEIFAEPGRSLVNTAGTLVTSVIGTSFRNNERWIYLDDGIYGCYSIKSYETTNFEFYLTNPLRRGIQANNSNSCTIAGPTCDSLDVIAHNVNLPSNISNGDIIITPNIGAYSLSTACTFNGFNPPQCHLIHAKVANNGKISTSIITENEDIKQKITTTG